ncbi:putative copper resistance protein D [Pseudoalteromonas ulvae UL12]|uniref:copper resistance D family protein n=1 Tax=Pseudoalteromonas ulvae TaxID=107327 RepID=UPI00186B7D2A|nr:CopD family protein [Pseudoalteromonas ulvae]MBE0365339.1 putative copper resistance protein D [Pseudoalteromonas ulvae UL12]
MEMYIWNTVIVLSKIVFYVGFACIAGYTFFKQVFEKSEPHNNLAIANLRWIRASIIVALIANAIWFFASTGAMAEEGIQGALEPDMLGIIWDSSIGDGTLLRGLGLVLAIFAITSHIKFKSVALSNNIKQSLLGLSLVLLSYTFSLFGHVSELEVFEKVLLMLHVLVMAWWFGALFPLKQACHEQDYEQLYSLMDKFGRQASIAVSLLLIAGLWLAFQLVGNVGELFSSSYGQTLLLKLALVTSILGIAAKHRLKLVPQLKNSDGREALSKSISIEMVVAFAILSVTAGLTSVVGPAN